MLSIIEPRLTDRPFQLSFFAHCLTKPSLTLIFHLVTQITFCYTSLTSRRIHFSYAISLSLQGFTPGFVPCGSSFCSSAVSICWPTNSNANRNAHRNPNRHANSDGYTDKYPDVHSVQHAYEHPYSHANTNEHQYTATDLDGDSGSVLQGART